MNVKTTSVSPLPGSPRRFTRRHVLPVAAGGLVLLAVGAAAWAAIGDRQAAAPTAGSLAVAPAVSRPLTANASEATWVFIVGSDDEANALRQAARSVPGPPSVVIVADSQEQADALANFELSLNPIREASGQGLLIATIVGALAAGR